MDKLPGPMKARALREEASKCGISDAEMVRRVVEEFLGGSGGDPSEDQVRGLAASVAPLLGMKPDRFVAFWRATR
jgi:hypothetical protein